MALACDHAHQGTPFQPAGIIGWGADVVAVLPPSSAMIGPHDRVLLVRAGATAWARAAGIDGPARPGAAGAFRLSDDDASRAFATASMTPGARYSTRAFLIPADLAAQVARDWPAGALWFDALDTIGPGTSTLWLSTPGPELPVGMSWLAREKAQPCARLEAVFSVPGRTCCRVIPLVDDVRLRSGDRVLRWPGPADDAPLTFVALAEPLGDVQRVWIALPPHKPGCEPDVSARALDLGLDPWSDGRVDFYRGARYIAHGVVERQDTRFGYVRTTREASAEVVQVGDRAILRTPTDLAAGRSSARLFFAPSRMLINAGEGDGIAPGSLATVMRAGRTLGKLRVDRVQPGYATVERVPEVDAGIGDADGGQHRLTASATSDEAFQPLDEVWFAPPPAKAIPIARIEHVSGDVFVARGDPGFRAQVGLPLAIEQPDGLICAVGLIVCTTESTAVGILIPESIMESPAPGARLMLEGAPASAPALQVGLRDGRDAGDPAGSRRGAPAYGRSAGSAR